MKRSAVFIENKKNAEYIKSYKKIAKLKLITINTHHQQKHQCSSQFCNPQSEVDIQKQKNLPITDTMSYNLFVCDLGAVHLCTVSECELYGSTQDQTCPVSGIQWASIVSNYSKNDSRTWYNKGTEMSDPKAIQNGPRQHAKKQNFYSESMIKNTTETLINLLLYSHTRLDRNQAAANDHIDQSQNAMNTYAKHRKNELKQMCYKTDLYRLNAHYCSQQLPLRILEIDLSRIEYYVHVVLQLWHICQKFYIHPINRTFNNNGNEIKNRLTPEVVALGVLYSMRQGITIQGVDLLPKDNYLENLPIIIDLSFFGVDKKKVTKGNKILLTSYNNAIDAGQRIIDLVLDVSKLPPILEQ